MDRATCSFCNQRDGVAPFHIALSNQAVSIGIRRSATLAVGGTACDACKGRLGRFARLRVIALLTLVGSFALVFAAIHAWTSSTIGGALVGPAIVLAAGGTLAALVPVLRWHRATAQALLTEAQREEILRRLPDLGGVIAWQQVRVFPGGADGAIPIAELSGAGAAHSPRVRHY